MTEKTSLKNARAVLDAWKNMPTDQSKGAEEALLALVAMQLATAHAMVAVAEELSELNAREENRDRAAREDH